MNNRSLTHRKWQSQKPYCLSGTGDYMCTCSMYIIGASLSEPHTSGYNAAFSLSIYIIMYGIYIVRHL